MTTRLQKIPLLYPETLEVPIRGQVQLRILELGDEAGEKKKTSVRFLKPVLIIARIVLRPVRSYKPSKERFFMPYFVGLTD